jgi:hypothetical protein
MLEELTVPTNPHTRFKSYRRRELVPQLDLPVCHKGHLAYVAMEASTSTAPDGAMAEVANSFPIYTVAFLFC